MKFRDLQDDTRDSEMSKVFDTRVKMTDGTCLRYDTILLYSTYRQSERARIAEKTALSDVGRFRDRTRKQPVGSVNIHTNNTIAMTLETTATSNGIREPWLAGWLS